MPFFFRERTSDAPPQASFSVENGSNARTFVLYDPTQEETGVPAAVPRATLTDQLRAALGTTHPGPSTVAFGSPGGRGSIDRVMPWADPVYYSLFADGVRVVVKPLEGFVAAEADTTFLAVPPVQTGYPAYQAFEFVVDYNDRPYAVLPNSRMNFRTTDFYGFNGESKRVYWYPEALRFCSWFPKEMDSRISATVSSAMEFYTSDPAHPANRRKFTGIPDMIIPDVMLTQRIYQLPLRYFSSDNSWLIKLKGYINQTPFWTGQGFKRPGAVLYLGPKVIKTYLPVQFLGTDPGEDEDDALEGSFASEILIDVELDFIVTGRGDLEVTRIPGLLFDPNNPYGVPLEVRPNRNWLAAGHNLAPFWPEKKFIYVHTTTAPDPNDYAKWQPMYPSWPLTEFLPGVDPDVSEQVTDL